MTSERCEAETTDLGEPTRCRLERSHRGWHDDGAIQWDGSPPPIELVKLIRIFANTGASLAAFDAWSSDNPVSKEASAQWTLAWKKFAVAKRLLAARLGVSETELCLDEVRE